MNALTASMGMRFLPPPSICALCGREVDPDEAVLIAATDEPHVELSVHALEALADVTLGEALVICRECAQQS